VSAEPALIAVVNDDTAFLTLMHELLSDEGYRTIIWIEGDSAFEMIRREQPSLVILDIRMEHPETGWMVLSLLRLDPSTTHIPVIVTSAESRFLREKEQRLSEMRCRTLDKPFELDELLDLVAASLGMR
jgi:CheY-like chemotaxis protein